MAGERKEVTFNVRARRSDVALIDAAAKILGKSRSAFIRESVEEDARAALKNAEAGK
jgi:uncharacterized protein (DUF1778 family)